MIKMLNYDSHVSLPRREASQRWSLRHQTLCGNALKSLVIRTPSQVLGFLSSGFGFHFGLADFSLFIYLQIGAQIFEFTEILAWESFTLTQFSGELCL